MKKTTVTKPSHITRQWHLIDLKNEPLGRISTQIATLLIGKNKPHYSTHLDCGDYVVAINANIVKLTGKKSEKKIYRHHTGYPGGFREVSFEHQLEKDARKIIQNAVSGMLPKNKLRDQRLKRLKVFASSEHSYTDKINPVTATTK